MRDFYFVEFRPLYDRFIAGGAIPQELHAEISAAFDHLMRKCDSDPAALSERDADKAIAHIKRATFDAFKLTFKNEIRERYLHLRSLRFSGVHDGKFHSEIESAWLKARNIAVEARRLETLSGKIDTDAWNASFAKWREIVPYADKFAQWETSPEVARAQVVSTWKFVAQITWGIALAFLGAIIGKLI